jgi:hypothetical protein
VTAGSALMTLFLCHLTALVLAVLLLHPLGLTDPTPGTPLVGPAASLGPGLRGHAAPLVHCSGGSKLLGRGRLAG